MNNHTPSGPGTVASGAIATVRRVAVPATSLSVAVRADQILPSTSLGRAAWSPIGLAVGLGAAPSSSGVSAMATVLGSSSISTWR